MKFSERKGYKEVSKVLQKEGMSDDLRNSLWNKLHTGIYKGYFFPTIKPIERFEVMPGLIESFEEAFFINFLKIPCDDNDIRIKDCFFEFKWFEVYDFIEFTFSHFSTNEILPLELNNVLVELNNILELELSAYRIVNGIVSDITSEQEIEMLEKVLSDEDFPNVNAHLKRALELLSDRKTPDYRNSIKESISAVESIAKEIVKKPDAELGKALAELEKSGKIHRALKSSYLSLYGYTSGADGIRHALMEEPNLTADDAKFFLLTCTSFINYLKSKM
jgi:AbiJ N-terminal domain 4